MKKSKKESVSNNRRVVAFDRARRTLPTEHDIAVRAYELFVQRGSEHGRDQEDWLIAETELLGSTVS